MNICEKKPLQRLLAGLLLCSLAACGGKSGNDQPGPAPPRDIDSLVRSLPDDSLLESPHFLEQLPEEFAGLWSPWHGDLDGVVKRRALRVLVPFGGYQYYYVAGRPRGVIVELLQKLEKHLNDGLAGGTRHLYVVPIPVSRDHLVRYLLEGHADLVAADLTVTPAREKNLRFSRPLLTNVSEVVITGPAAPPLETLDDLAGKIVVVRQSSSYYEHLQPLIADFEARKLEPPILHLADELLEAEDLLEMVDVGTIAITVMDDYKAKYWSTVFPNITVRNDLVINANGEIAWAMSKQSEKLAASIEDFLQKNGRGTLVGNDTFNRYLADASKVRCVMTPEALEKRDEMARWMQLYADEYDFDWLMLAAQGYQESRLNQSKRSPAGAIGVMQVKPSTAADKNVNVPDVRVLENNIHAGAKYMRFIADRYFSQGMDEMNRWFFSLAAYNAGPARVARLRAEAQKNGLDPNHWFDNVEIIAARRIGRETIGYVANIYKHFVGYKLAAVRLQEEVARHGGELKGCQAS